MSETTFAYAQPSALTTGAEGQTLQLVAYAGKAITRGAAYFFRGQLRDSWLTARGLTTLAKAVASWFVPQAAALRDPIVTTGAGQLRFEAFSSCNGVYARLSLGPAALDGEFVQSGTTNVDFNEPMVSALSRIGRTEPVRLSVGQQEVTLERAAGHVIERKVTLPERWLKGLTAAQGYLTPMDEKLRLNRVQATQLLRSLRSGTAKGAIHLVLRGARLSFPPVGGPSAVRVGGGHEFLLALSAEVKRGFSGEGTQLWAILDELPAEWLAGANNLFWGNETFNPTLFGLTHNLAPSGSPPASRR